jgi:hypothetical protein
MSAVLGDLVLGDVVLGEDAGASPQTANVNDAAGTWSAGAVVAGLAQTANVNDAMGGWSAGAIVAGLAQTANLNAAAGDWSAAALTTSMTSSCWDGITQRLLGYLAPLFTRDSGSLLGRFLASLARELSNCAESVSLVKSRDVRGDGTFTIQTLFEPIESVASVNRVAEDGTVLEGYTVESFDGRKITLAKQARYGSFKYGARRYGFGTPPRRGDILEAGYSYTHTGLEYRIRRALLELNVLTATGEFLDAWGRWFNVPRLSVGRYGSFKYGAGKYGGHSFESDSQYSRRIIARVQQSRNTKPDILAAVKTITGSAYMVEWFERGADRGWVFRPSDLAPWMGEDTEGATRFHAIFGLTTRFLNLNTDGGGRCTAEIWVPQSNAYTVAQVLQMANAYKAAAIRLFVRYRQKPKVFVELTDSGAGSDSVSISTSVIPSGPTTALSLYRFDPGAGLLADEGSKLTDLTRSDICEA